MPRKVFRDELRPKGCRPHPDFQTIQFLRFVFLTARVKVISSKLPLA